MLVCLPMDVTGLLGCLKWFCVFSSLEFVFIYNSMAEGGKERFTELFSGWFFGQTLQTGVV